MQPSQDLLSTPRRPLDVEDYIDILRRHKSWIIAPTFAGLVISVVVAFLWPNTYISEASIRVQPPLVPERFVPTNINTDLTQRINSMYQEIVSGPNLRNVISSHQIYKKELENRPMQDVVEKMKGDIRISPVSTMRTGGDRNPISAFRISFEYPDRHKAQAVTGELVKGFMTQNEITRRSQSTATTQFLDDSLKEAKVHLDEIESQMTQFRLKNVGRLPDQMQANLQTLRTLEIQLSGVNESISRVDQEKYLLESQIRIARDQLKHLASEGSSAGVAIQNERFSQLDQQIATMETNLTALRERYRDTHPDVRAMQAQIAVMKSNREALMKSDIERKPDPTPRPPSPNQVRAQRDLEMQIAGLQSQIQAKNLEIQERVREQKQLRDQISMYNARIQASPVMEGDYAKLSRDYALAKERYDELNSKRAQSKIATDLESRKQGELLEVLEDPTLPETPAKPNRWLIVGAGFGMGLIAGIFLAGAREMKDTSLKSLKDARAYTNLPVLGTIPLLENDLVVRRKRRLAWLGWSVACIVGIGAMTASVYVYYTAKG